MSETAFEFQSKPFSSVPDTDNYVPLSMHHEAIQALVTWARDGEGVALLTGAAGLGKTLLSQRVISDLEGELRVILLPHGNFPNILSFLKAVLYQLHCNYAGLDEDELRLELGGALQDLAGEEQPLMLIIDGAHEMSESMLQEVQILVSSSESLSAGLMVLLCGQLELEELLTRRSLSGLNQQTRTHQILEPLTRSESADYLAGRIECAGNDIEAIMTEEAVELMTHLSDGVPRCLNRLAETSIRVATSHHSESVDRESVREAFEDVRHLPLHWNSWPEETSQQISRQNSVDEHSGDHLSSLEDADEDLLDADEEHFTESALPEAAEGDDFVVEKAAAPQNRIPDLKQEAEEAGVEYAVAEFGGEEVQEEQASVVTRNSAEARISEESFLELSSVDVQNGESSRQASASESVHEEVELIDDSEMYVIEIGGPKEDEPKDEIEALETAREGIQTDLESLVDMMKSTTTGKSGQLTGESADSTEAAHPDYDYLRSRLNPVDIFALDIPEEEILISPVATIAAEPEISTPTEAAVSIQEPVQEEITEEVDEQVSGQTAEYDVIEPEQIPEISKIRPTLELDLPHRESQPRYRNLFRDLRRRQG